MLNYSAYINTASDTVCKDIVTVYEKASDNGVTAVFIDAIAPNSIGIGEDYTIHPDKGVVADVAINADIKSCMANYRRCEYWCAPYFADNTKNLPDETQLLIIKLKTNEFLVVVPVVNDKYKSVIRGKSESEFSVRCFSRCEGLFDCKGLSFLYAVGENPFELTEKCVKTALEILNNGTRHRHDRRYPAIFDTLGWCSWDAMQIRVSEEGLLEKCEEFKEKNIPVKWAILDDMWMEVHSFYGKEYANFGEMVTLMHRSALSHFDADPIRFPNGLKHTIDKIKEYGISVGLWHPTTGYWRGIEKDGEAYRRLKDCLIKTKNHLYVPDWHTEKSYMYYKTIHDFYKKCGAEFVKIDNQSMSNRYYNGLAPVGQVAKDFHDGMEASVGEHFDNQMINCMGMASEDMWTRTVSPISRTSGDFQPENKEWFQKHILQCAYNSILQGQFYWCDWDMWWTDDGQASKNSLMRAVSGGPIYISDKINRSNADLLKPLALDNGQILRCDRPGVPAMDCVTEDCTINGKALKVQNIAGEHGVLAVLNIDNDEKAVTATICIEDIDGLKGEEYAVYEHFSKSLTFLKPGESFEVTLASPDAYKLYIFAPVKDGFAVIGRTDKFISPKTIKYVHNKEVVLTEEGPYAYVENGKLIFN